MKKNLILIAITLFAGVARAQTTAPPTPTPQQVIAELTQAFVDSGVDSTIAAGIAQLWQLSFAGAQVQATLASATRKSLSDFATKESSDIQAVNDNANALQARVAVLEATPAQKPPSYAVPIGYTVRAQATYPAGSSVAPNIVISTGADNGLKLVLGGAGSFYDYVFNVPQAGNYSSSVRVSVSAATTTPLVFHLETPPGTATLSLSYLSTSGNWAVVAGPAIALQAGPQVVRLVVDQPSPLVNQVNWISLTKQ